MLFTLNFLVRWRISEEFSHRTRSLCEVILVNEKQGVTWWGNKLPPFANFALNIDNDNSWYAMFTSDILDSFGAKAYHSNL